MSLEKLSLSLLFDVDPFGLEADEEFEDELDGRYPCVACSHFSKRSANSENNGCLKNKKKINFISVCNFENAQKLVFVREFLKTTI